MNKTREEFEKDLRDELEKLQIFGELYDKGKVSFYKEMAISFRKIFFDSKSSTSLLTHLGMKDKVNLLSQCSGKSSIGEEIFFMGMGIVKNGKYIPNFKEGIVEKYIKVNDYFSEIVFIYNGEEFNRSDIFKIVADKDGGAHYDKTLPSKYLLLKNAPSKIKLPLIGIIEMENIIGTILRQMSYEILNSPDLIKFKN